MTKAIVPNNDVAGIKLRDGLILIAGFAVGLASSIRLVRLQTKAGLGEAFAVSLAELGAEGPSFRRVSNLARLCTEVYIHFVPFLIAFSIALLLCRLLPPRPPLRRIAREPGFVATAAIACGALVFLPAIVRAILRQYVLAEPGIDVLRYLPTVARTMNLTSASSVLAAWVVLAVSGRWRSRCDWVDRLGRIFAVVWLLPLVLESIRFLA